MRYITSIFIALIALTLTMLAVPAMADEPTVFRWGCEWRQASNGNYLTKVDGGCKHYRALGYSNTAEYLRDVLPEDDSANEPDPGEGPDCEPDA